MNYYKMGPIREIKEIWNLNIHDLLILQKEGIKL
jgi:hypothetical protein